MDGSTGYGAFLFKGDLAVRTLPATMYDSFGADVDVCRRDVMGIGSVAI